MKPSFVLRPHLMRRLAPTSRWLRASLLVFVLLSGMLVLLSPTQTHHAHAQSSATISVDANTTYQTIDGFGVAEVGTSGAPDIYNMNSAQQQQVLDLLFNQATGAGFSMYRFELDAGVGYGNTPDFTIEPNNPGSPPATPNYVWDHSADRQVWLAQQAQQRGVNLIYGDAWSAPAYMKDNNNVNNGGTLCGEASCASGDWRQAYANYLVQYVKDFQSDGVNVTHVGFVNEPSFAAGYQSMVMNASQLTDFTKVLGPTIANANLSTKIVCCDETGFDNTNTVQNTLLADSTAASYEAVASAHDYGANAVAFTSATNAGKHSWQTENSCIDNTFDPSYSGSGVGCYGDRSNGQFWSDVIYKALVNGVNLYSFWIGASDNANDESLINITSPTSYQVSSRLWAFANYSRYVRPGATRIGASSSDGNMYVTSFRNTDGSYVLVVDNHNGSATNTGINIPALSSGTATPYVTDDANGMTQQSDLSITNGSFTATIPPNATVTFRINGQSVVSGTAYAIKNQSVGKCIDNSGGSSNNGNPIQIYDCSAGNPNQVWTFNNVGGNYYQLVNQATGKCLDNSGGSSNNGNPIQLWDCGAGNQNQAWAVTGVGGGYVELVNQSTGKCIDNSGGSSNNGNRIQLYTCYPGTDQNQSWQLIAPSSLNIANNSFETPNVGSGNFQYNPSGGSWTFDSGSGISGNGSGFTSGNPNAPDGNQVAFLQKTGTFSLSISGFQPSTSYTVTFSAAQRGNWNQGGQDFQVLLDGSSLGTFKPSSSNYATFSTNAFTTSAGSHTLEFLGLDSAGGDNTALIDNVSITQQ